MRYFRHILLFLLLSASLAQAQTTQPIQYGHESRTDPPMQLHSVKVDLSNPNVRLDVAMGGQDPDGDGPWKTTLQPVRAIAEREKFDLAINGDFFQTTAAQTVMGRQVKYLPNAPGRPSGWSMSDGNLATQAATGASLIVHKDRRVSLAALRAAPADAEQIISGNGFIVANGRNVASDQSRHPRTAVGLDKDHTTLIILVVDGRRPNYSIGMTTPELAEEMIRLGAHEAINLDGGGSSTLVMRDEATGTWQIKNRPCDGSDLDIPLSIERNVANALGITIIKPEEN